MMKLPEPFSEEMKTLLGAEYEAWLASQQESPAQGLRINTAKLSTGQWERMAPFAADPVPWAPEGYYIPEGTRPAKHPWYHAGLYYIQEPSAMAPAALLPVKPGDRVLDLCAAPGGKSTALGARLQGSGLLVANDLSHSRAKALLRNLERFGIPNLCVSSEAPQKLADTFGAFFDAVLVDAPCSGEGMFRKDPDLVRSWCQRGPADYAPLQQEILTQAVRMVRPGGYLLYSTCTFSKQEDEDVICAVQKTCPEMELQTLPMVSGACRGTGGEPVLRLYPHRIRGEGHFLALFRKRGGEAVQTGGGNERLSSAEKRAFRQLEKETNFSAWESMCPVPFDRERLLVLEDRLYLLPREFDRNWRLRYLRTGLLLGSRKGKQFEPSQAAAMAMEAASFSQRVSFDHGDERVTRYLKGETVFADEAVALAKGWVLVCVDGFPLGWAKNTGNALKNKYDAGWRISNSVL